MKISSLADCPHLSLVIAQWHFGEWGHLYPGGTVDGWLHHIRTRMNADRIQMTVVALDGAREPVGTAALTEHDMETHRELSPWLGGVYIIPPARRRGVASALVLYLMGRAADFGIRTLHLYTNGAEGLYQKLDWRVLSREPYMGREVTIMTSTPSDRPSLEPQTSIKLMSQWADPDRWASLRSGEACVICRQGAPKDVLVELETSWVTVNEDALMPGYACLVFRRHVVELHDLSEAEGAAFMRDIRRLSAAVQQVTGAVKLSQLTRLARLAWYERACGRHSSVRSNKTTREAVGASQSRMR